MAWLAVVIVLGLGGTVLIAYLVAKREYELEELSEEVPEKPRRRIEPPKVRKCVVLQSAFVGISLALLFTGKLPREAGIAVIVFTQLFLLALTVLFSRPLVFQLAPNFKGKMALGFARALTVVSAVITLWLFLIVTGYEPGRSKQSFSRSFPSVQCSTPSLSPS
ncbi:hypothetical membrane protein, conserved [Thermococcus onnurineus NA1]|uniref:Hypothetical membrane protein, conserved n=1 Tax=Thermococcus onnurineus (strain NA1) TaxID=523850 RepID=B6YW53_THEON|nr:hypothetical protein [Thermococcus onnurineus]ACJ17419.1 hypothetical membrane protein, conserved [Thermococcus onnurineus NA1]